MSIPNELKTIARRVVLLRRQTGIWAKTQRWFWMLYHEFLRNEVQIRAQSLAFLMVFSLLPLIAGAFFIFTFLAQFGMVQDALARGMENLVSGIPIEQRTAIQEYILQFKDAYLANLTEASSSVGIFALFVLLWVGLQAFNNLDSTLNYLWSSDRERPLAEKIRNFIVISVVAPVLLIAGFSVPLILSRISVTQFFLQRFTLLGVLLNYVVPLSLLFGIFLVMYRYVPVRRVWWKSALWGAFFATLTLEITNLLMRFYFQVGTNSAYGKAAAVPLIGFWIYLLWIVVILGAQVSFLIQNEEDVFAVVEDEPTLRQGQGLLWILSALFRSFHQGEGPISFEALRKISHLNSFGTRYCLRYLMRQKLVIETIDRKTGEGGCYSLARDTEGISLQQVLHEFYECPSDRPSVEIERIWSESVQQWLAFFEKTKVSELAK